MVGEGVSLWGTGGLVGIAFGLGTLFLGVFRAWQATTEYLRRGSARRAHQFFALRAKLHNDQSFNLLCNLLEHDDERLRQVPFDQKDAFLSLFHEIFLLLNSKIINIDVAYYMFGYYALKCAQSEQFWEGLIRESPFYRLFFAFVERLKKHAPNDNAYVPKPAFFKL